MNLHSTRKSKENPEYRGEVHQVWKERGETLAQLLARFKKEARIKKTIPVAYAGRLDPMAQGIVVLLVGDARFEKEQYQKLAKIYTFQVLLGVSTDTYDVLGRITHITIPPKEISNQAAENVLEKIKKTPLPYPPFSSKPLDGVPLFVRAKAGTLPRELPLQPGVPKEIIFIKEERAPFRELIEKIISDVQKVEGDFRQQSIIEGWKKVQSAYEEIQVPLLTFEATVPSGVYIRSIAHEIGNQLGTHALAYSITRTRFKGI